MKIGVKSLINHRFTNNLPMQNDADLCEKSGKIIGAVVDYTM